MKNIYLFIIIFVFSSFMVGCASTSTVPHQTIISDKQVLDTITNPSKKSSRSFLPADIYDPITCRPKFIDGLIHQQPIKTGIDEDRYVELMPIQKFRTKLKSSLGSYYIAQSSDSDEFTLPKLNASLYVTSNKYSILKIYYTTLNGREKSKYKHQLLPQEKFAMTKLINIFIDNQDKSEQILQRLYQQYMIKVKNHEVLEDNETIFTYLEYDGKIFGLMGLQRVNHPLPNCDIEVLSGLTIQ